MNGKCKHHPSQDAVAQCNGCGAFICRECAEMYGLSGGEYAGQYLCYDCTIQLVASNVAQVDAFKKKTQMELIFIGIGTVVGFILGMATGGFGAAIFVGLLGGSALMVLKGIGAALKMGSNLASGSYVGFVAGVIGFFKAFFVAPIATIVTVIKRIKQIKQCSVIIASDAQALAELHDYFAYTQSVEKAAEGEGLFDNSYTQKVKAIGEKSAHAELHRDVAQIAANGEIIRGFDAKNP